MRVVTTAAVALVLAAAAGGAPAGTTERVSGGDFVQPPVTISGDGRFVTFTVEVICHFGCIENAVIRDRRNGTTTFVCEDAQQDTSTAISRGGRFVLCQTSPAEDVAEPHAHLVDRRTGADIFMPGGGLFDQHRYSVASALSPHGRYVVFASNATDLVPDDTNGQADVFVRDVRLRQTSRVSLGPNGGQGNGFSEGAGISADARFVGFVSEASNLVEGDTNKKRDVFIRDRRLRTTERVSVATGGAQANDDSNSGFLSDDGRIVAFDSLASNLVEGDHNGKIDVFVRDRQAGTTTRISLGRDGGDANGDSHVTSLSPDGRFVVFQSDASNLVAGDGNGVRDVFVHARQTRTTERASVSSKGVGGDKASGDGAISADGRVVAFFSDADNLVPRDADGIGDVFVRLR
jgi:Tol biopolymer transport system component